MKKKQWKQKGLRLLTMAVAISMIASSPAFAGVWRQEQQFWKYQQDNGEYVRNQWMKDTDGRWYHFDADGIMQTGWFLDADGTWYYLSESGAMLSKTWYQDTDGKWYYLDVSGAMVASDWRQDAAGQWYYLGRTGEMQMLGVTPDGYTLRADGSWNEAVSRWTYTDDSDDDSGSKPEKNPGENPGEDLGENPGEDPGENPGEDPGETPGEDPGENPGEDPGEDIEKPVLQQMIAMAVNGAENAGAVTEDTIEVITGRTYRFTVDTDNNQESGLTTTAVTAGEFLKQMKENLGSDAAVSMTDAAGSEKSSDAEIVSGDVLTAVKGAESSSYTVQVKQKALRAVFESNDQYLTVGSDKELILNFHAGQRTPNGTVIIDVPAGIDIDVDDTYVNIIGRGEVALSELSDQSPGRYGGGYDVKVGDAELTDLGEAGTRITLSGLDLRPDNGIDVQLRIPEVYVNSAGTYTFKASYQVTEPDAAESPVTALDIKAVEQVTSFARTITKDAVYDVKTDYQAAEFTWADIDGADSVTLMHSDDKGATWSEYSKLDPGQTEAAVEDLEEDMEHWFRLDVVGGSNAGRSNIAKLYSGMYNVRTKAGAPTDGSNAAAVIDEAIAYMNSLGGGTVLFEGGNFSTTTIHLMSNVYLYIDESAELRALKGCDAPEVTWFSDKDYRSGTSPTSSGPYKNPENWLTKQDVGHTYWQNAMFYGQRLDNIKIIGNGRIAGNGSLNTGDGVMNNSADNRADKMVALKLCTNFEMGGLKKSKDLWYEETADPNNDQPFYLESDGVTRDENISNMLRISKGGHFVLLATGVDGVNTHDVYAEKSNGGVRDIFDYMACNDVMAYNIYAEGSSDDIVKPGSDCSLGFTRPVSNYIVRNIIGDTNCNLFQIGSETADDIQNICVDNIYVLAGNKAGFSISTNDGGHIKDIHLNCGGSVGACEYDIEHEDLSIGYTPSSAHPYRSEMRRTRAPFFLSISNRGRTMGGEAERFQFTDPNGTKRDELLSLNVNIGQVENIFINNVNVEEVYGGSQYKGTRWAEYKSQNKAVPIIAGYKVPEEVGITLPDGRGTGYLENVIFNNVDVLVKGGNPLSDADNSPKEMGVGQYNVGDLAGDAMGSMLPSYGFWARHVKGFVLNDCSVDFETNDDRYAIVLDDVEGASLNRVSMVQPENNRNVLELLNSKDVSLADCDYKDINDDIHEMDDLNDVTVVGKQTYPYNVSMNAVIVKNDQTEGNVVEEITDTEEGKFIKVIFGAEAEALLKSIKAEDGSSQLYEIFRGEDEITTGALATGDVLKVTSESRTVTAEYSVDVNASASTDIKIVQADGPVQFIDNEAKEIRVLKGTTLESLKAAIASTDDSEQLYEIAGLADADVVADGAVLVITAADGTAKAEYTVQVTEDLRVQITEDGYFVQTVDTVKGTINVLAGTTPSQLKSSLEPKDEAIELKMTVLDKDGNERTSGSVADGDVLRVELADAEAALPSDADNFVDYTIKTVQYSSSSIVTEGETSKYAMFGASMTTKTNNDSNASNGGNRQFENCQVGDYVEIIIPDLPAGSYELIYTYKTANNNRRGIIGAVFNGTELEGEADANSTVANVYVPYSYGSVYQETNGDAVIRLTVVAPGTGSAPYNFIVDCLELKGNPSPNTNIAAGSKKVVAVDNDARTIIMKAGSEVEDVLQTEAADGSKQTYAIERNGEEVKEGDLEDGDVLIVTAQDGVRQVEYTISIDETVVSTELEFNSSSLHWVSGELVIEPGTLVSELSDLITSGVDLEFDVSAGSKLRGQDDVICDGDTIRVYSTELLNDEELNEEAGERESDGALAVLEAQVYSETRFAFAVDGSYILSDDVSFANGSGTVKVQNDSIYNSGTENAGLRIPYATIPQSAGRTVLKADVPAAGSYLAELIYKGGTRSAKVSCYLSETDTLTEGAVADAELNVAETTGTLWLADLADRNTSKTYMEKTIAQKYLNKGTLYVIFDNNENKDMVLVEVRLTLLNTDAEEDDTKDSAAANRNMESAIDKSESEGTEDEGTKVEGTEGEVTEGGKTEGEGTEGEATEGDKTEGEGTEGEVIEGEATDNGTTGKEKTNL
ncbi:MAG: hypothetical protein MR868_04505 [Lachnospiraceae bacterium]|nr:hypothetical protein [Lachnospiraceae bacterium]